MKQLELRTKDLPYVTEPVVLSESEDGRIVIALPIRYRMDRWSSDEKNQIKSRLALVEADWIKDKLTILKKIAPPAIGEGIASTV